MYSCVLVTQYGIFKKGPAGNVATYNNMSKHVKIIEGLSQEDCIAKADEFLKENDFSKIGERNEQRSCETK